MSCAWWWMERGLRLRRQDVNATGDTRHGRWGTASGSTMSYGDYDELELCDELAWCSQAGTRDTELTGCVVGQARQVVVRSMCGRYGHLGAVYLCQTCWAERMWDHVSKICHRYGGVTSYGSDWLHRHGIQWLSCSECLWTQRSSKRPIDTISKCYETCFRWWCGSRASWQWLSNLEELCFSGWIYRQERGINKGSYMWKSILQGAKVVQIWCV